MKTGPNLRLLVHSCRQLPGAVRKLAWDFNQCIQSEEVRMLNLTSFDIVRNAFFLPIVILKTRKVHFQQFIFIQECFADYFKIDEIFQSKRLCGTQNKINREPCFFLPISHLICVRPQLDYYSILSHHKGRVRTEVAKPLMRISFNATFSGLQQALRGIVPVLPNRVGLHPRWLQQRAGNTTFNRPSFL